AVSAVKDRSCRINPRTYHYACLNHFRLTENHFSVSRRVMRSSYTKSQVGEIIPILLRRNAIRAGMQMGMNIDYAGHDGFAGSIIHFCIGGYGYFVVLAHIYYPVFVDNDSAVLDYLIAFHGDDAGIFEYDLTIRYIG